MNYYSLLIHLTKLYPSRKEQKTKVEKLLIANDKPLTDGLVEQAFLDTFIHKPLLVIDDLGENDTSGNAEWAKRDRERLSEILDNRYQSMPTIITSNMTVDQVEQFLGDRAFDRLQERLVIIRCDWESHRQQNRVVMEL